MRLSAWWIAPLALPVLFFGNEPKEALGQTTPAIDVTITYIGHAERELPSVSLVEPLLEDEGLKGAQQAIGDNQTTGKFLGHNFELAEIVVPEESEVRIAFADALEQGHRLFIADLLIDDLLAIVPLAEEAGALLFNSRAPDDSLRTDSCFASVLHVTPSRAMLADGLAQYLMWKRWDKWALIHGSHTEDSDLAAAYRRAAQRYGAKIVEEREYEDSGGARRTDSGHVQVQRQNACFHTKYGRS